MSDTNRGKIKYSPSMMCADYINLKDELDVLVSQHTDMLHIDIMDGKYVPNFNLCQSLGYQMQAYSGIPLDFHLMVDQVDQVFELFAQRAGNYISFHPETSWHPLRTIQKIRELACKPSIAISPAVSLTSIEHLLGSVDMVCMMTVNPGFAGQKLIPLCLDKISEVAKWRRKNDANFLIEVDGNVSWENIPKMLSAGADVLVLGTSSVFNQKEDRNNSYKKLNQLIKQHFNA